MKIITENDKNTTVEMKSYDKLMVKYMAPDGRNVSIVIDTMHNVVVAEHVESSKALVIRPGAIHFID